MKTKEIKTLLLKYYDGLTSPLEESSLEEYFLNGKVDPEFQTDQQHFIAVAAMRDEAIWVPDDLETEILAALREVQYVKRTSYRRVLYIGFSVAAGLLLMVSTFLFISGQNKTEYVSDPKIAYAESREALELVSKYFNVGTSRLAGLSKINQAVEPLGKLNSLDKAARSLSLFGKLQNEK